MAMLEAFQTLGLTTELDKEGLATAFASQSSQADCLEFTVMPGSFRQGARGASTLGRVERLGEGRFTSS